MMNDTTNTKGDNATESNEMQADYGADFFHDGVRGKHFAAYQRHINAARLAPDVRAAFPTDEAVNEALRGLIRISKVMVTSPEPAQGDYRLSQTSSPLPCAGTSTAMRAPRRRLRSPHCTRRASRSGGSVSTAG